MSEITVTGIIKDPYGASNFPVSGKLRFKLDRPITNSTGKTVAASTTEVTISPTTGAFTVSLESTTDAVPNTALYTATLIGVLGGRQEEITLGQFRIFPTPSSQILSDLLSTAVGTMPELGVSSSNLIFLQAGTGAVERTVQDKLRERVSVTDFGAVGDGVTDNTIFIQKAIDRICSTGGVLYFPNTSSSIYLTSNLTLDLVAGKPIVIDLDTSVLKMIHTSGIGLDVTGTFTARDSMSIRNGAIDYAGVATGITGIKCQSATYCVLDSLQIRHFDTANSTALIFDSMQDSKIEEVEFNDNTIALSLEHETNQNEIISCWFHNNFTAINVKTGSSGNSFNDCLIQSTQGARAISILCLAVDTETVISGIRFNSCWFESNGDTTAASRQFYVEVGVGRSIQNVSFNENTIIKEPRGASGTHYEFVNAGTLAGTIFRGNYYAGGTPLFTTPPLSMLQISEGQTNAIVLGLQTYLRSRKAGNLTDAAIIGQDVFDVVQISPDGQVTYITGELKLASHLTMLGGRVQQSFGAYIDSADDLVLTNGNSFQILGTHQIKAINTTGWQAGSRVTLWFVGACLILHNTAGGAGTAPIKLAGNVNVTTDADFMITLLYDSISWQEISRKDPRDSGTFLQAGTGAVVRTVQSKQRDIVSVFDFMTAAQVTDVINRNGSLDVTSAIQAAIDAFGDNCTIYFPAGLYKITSTISVVNMNVNLLGAGKRTTTFYFAPTANDTCLEIKDAGSGMVNVGSVRGIGFYSDDSTYVKVAIDSIDVSQYTFDDLMVMGGVLGVTPTAYFWSDSTQSSIAFRTNGREAVTVSDYFFVADKPLVIAVNPNHGISIDHYHFTDAYMIANNRPIVTINSNVNLNMVVFDGRQAWVSGTYGLYWVDTQTVGQSENLILRNIRWEQSQSITSEIVHIEHNTRLRVFIVSNMRWGNNGAGVNGIYLRKVINISLTDLQYDEDDTMLDMNSTCRSLDMNNVVAATATSTAAVNLTGVMGISGSVYFESISLLHSYLPTPPTSAGVVVQRFNPSLTLGFSQLEPLTIVVAANTIIKLASNVLCGIVMISALEASVSATIGVNGDNNGSRLMSFSDAGWWGVAAASANYNIYSSGGEYKLQNNTASSASFKINFMGWGER